MIGGFGLIITRYNSKRSVAGSSGSSQCIRPVPPGITLDALPRHRALGSSEVAVTKSEPERQLDRKAL